MAWFLSLAGGAAVLLAGTQASAGPLSESLAARAINGAAQQPGSLRGGPAAYSPASSASASSLGGKTRRAKDRPGVYAESFVPLKTDVRDFEHDPQNRYTYCIRSTAVYECVSYGSDGSLMKRKSSAMAHGTGFAYRQQGGETFLLTNQHVSDWPAVTDSMHKVDDVPTGCKRVSSTLKIVDNDDDEYGADDVPLTPVVSDEALDISVVKAKARLRVLPYRIGSAKDLTTGDVVMVRGFPLGVFQAVNTGRVVNPDDRDDYKEWHHQDFIIDAPLSSGNSGSPVLAVSRRTGEYELVGVFHASYVRATALNAVIAIDQLRDLMVTFKRPPPAAVADGSGGPAQREELLAALSRPTFAPNLALGPLDVTLRPLGERIVYQVFSRHFPLDDRPIAVFVDQPSASSLGSLTQVFLGNEHGFKGYGPAAFGSAERSGAPFTDGDSGQVQAVMRRLHTLAAETLRYRALAERSLTSRQALADAEALRRSINREETTTDQDLAAALQEMADRLSPWSADQASSLGEVWMGLQPNQPNQPIDGTRQLHASAPVTPSL